jgi:hypothetical protein|tara:strand:+ start:260 stop:637 length:378 start_codon:yes stop_codon:yes gene_type:complete
MEKETTLNNLMDDLATTRGEIHTLQEKEKSLRLRRNELESKIMWKMEEQGLDQIANDACTISKKLEIVPTVEDWDLLHQHILNTNQFELLQKRMSATAYREFLQMDMSVPGVKATELTKINYRSK